MSKIIPTYTEYIFEGRYDQLTGILTREIFKTIKIAYSFHSLGISDELGAVDEDGFYGMQLEYNKGKNLFDTEVFVRLKFSDSVSGNGFSIDGGAWTTGKLSSEIEIEIVIDPNQIPKIYSKLNGFIQDAIRHEIEHLTQAGPNKNPERPLATREKTRNKISIDLGNSYKYFILRDEIPAMVHGMYRKAKIEKISLDNAFDIYLNYMIEEKVISIKERDIILKKWFEYSLKKLPTAQYSKKYNYILDKLQKN